MQPLIIVLFIALIAALLVIREIQHQLGIANSLVKFWTDSSSDWRDRYFREANTTTKLLTDAAFLRAELKRKHRRVPKL